MRNGVYVTVRLGFDVCTSVCLSHLWTAVEACGGFAAYGAPPAGDIDQQRRALGAQQHMRAVSRLHPP